jgi:hypothetical protein
MAKSGRSWNDPKSARARAAGPAQSGSGTGSAGSAPAGAPPASGAGRSGWRDKSAPAAAQAKKGKYWSTNQTDNSGWLRHRMKLAMAGGALLLLIGYFLYTVMLSPKNTPLLLLGVLDYAAPFPPNAWAAEDFSRFGETFLTEDGFGGDENIRVHPDLVDERNWKDGAAALLEIEQALKKIKPGGPGRDAVLIYLSGHGILDSEGRPCLVLPTVRNNNVVWQPQPTQTSQPANPPVLDMQELIGTIEKSYEGKDIKKVLLLDCSRIYASPRLGILENGFAEALKDLQFKDDNLFLLSSADVGQRGWVLPDLRGSAFGYFVCKGLEGGADGALGGETDKEVTLDELYQYLRERVGQQVQAQYMAKQTPVLLPDRSEGSAHDVRLTWWRPETQPKESEEKTAVAWERIDELWRAHSELKQAQGGPQNESTAQWLAQYNLEREPAAFYRGSDVLSFEAFQQGLLRLEQLNDAGQHYTSEASALADSLQAAAKSLKPMPEESQLPAALALRRVRVTDDVQQQAEGLINNAPPKKPEELEAFQQAPYEQRAKAAWNYWLGWARSRSSQVDNETMRRTLDGVLALPKGGSASDADNCDPVEIRFLRLLGANKYAPGALFSDQVMALQSAILSRDLAEAAAWANEDDRVHYAVTQLVAQGDAERRKYEDQLFFRPSDAATGRQWPEAESQYKQALELALELTAALDARDQAWQDLPYLAQWLVLRHATESNVDEANGRLAACKQLFAHTQKLAEQIKGSLDKCLTGGVTPDEESRKKLVEATRMVSEDLSDLVRHHRDAISDARQKGAENVLSRRQMLDLLTTPLLTGQDRVDLRKAFLRKRKVEALTKSDAQAASKSASIRVPLEDRPLLAYFGPDAPAHDTGGRLAGELRGLLKKRFDEARSNAESAATSATSPVDRVKLATAEQAAREAAALWTLSPTYGDAEKSLSDPLNGLQEFDRHHALVWQAGRALDDFWGKEGDPRNSSYFVDYAKLTERTARALGPGENSAALKQLNTLLADRQTAAENWAALSVPNIKLPPGNAPPTVDARPEISVKKEVPTGRASFLVQRESSNDWQKREAAPFNQQLAAVRLDLPAVPDVALVKWTAGLFYRGHVVEQGFGVTQKEPGQVVEIAKANPVAPRIWVGGGEKDPGAITFIFDCSGSMGLSAPGGGTRMSAAKNAFRAALQQISDAGNYRVSVWFFGHRLIFDDRPNVKRVVKVTDYWPQIAFPAAWKQPDTKLLSDDVAQEWPDPLLRNRGPVNLNKQNLGDVLGLLDVVQPAGTTPLYLSIVRAIQDDVNLQGQGTPRRLIVLTDGANDVWEEEKDRRNVEARDVVTAIKNSSALKNQQIQLHVIAFGDAAAGRSSWKETILPEIGQPTHYYDTPVNQRELEEVIRKTCNLKQFDVASDNERIGRQKVPGEIVLTEHRGRQTYDVNVVGSKKLEQLPLEGGEAINLYVVDAQSQDPRLQHKRYERDRNLDKSATARLVATSTAAAPKNDGVYVGFHPPLRQGGIVNFPISIQNADETKFSRRPAEAWVEITPLGAGANNYRPLLFYDLQFESGRPVPVLACRTANLPPGVQRAKVNLFFKLDPTTPGRWQRVSDAEGAEPDPDLDVSLDSGGKVRFSVSAEALAGQNASRITVVERCAQEGDLRQVKVEIDALGGAAADRTRREYFHSSDEQEVRHTFTFLGKNLGDVRKYRVQVTSRKELEVDAYKLAAPIEVSILGR